MDEGLLKTGDFVPPQFNLGEYVDEFKLDAKRRIEAKEKFLDEAKVGMKPASPMPKGTFVMNKNFASVHTGDLYQVCDFRPACRRCPTVISSVFSGLPVNAAPLHSAS